MTVKRGIRPEFHSYAKTVARTKKDVIKIAQVSVSQASEEDRLDDMLKAQLPRRRSDRSALPPARRRAAADPLESDRRTASEPPNPQRTGQNRMEWTPFVADARRWGR